MTILGAKSLAGEQSTRLAKSRIGRFLKGILSSQQIAGPDRLAEITVGLVSLRGRSSGASLAAAFFEAYENCDGTERAEFLHQLPGLLELDSKHDPMSAMPRLPAFESQSNAAHWINQLNLAPRGTQQLIALRSDLLDAMKMGDNVHFKTLDTAMSAAFAAWFNVGFLELKRISWDSSARLLERIIRYEAVHHIQGWEELRQRVEPADRRCYGFFHPQMPDEPLIFVEVALTASVPGTISTVITADRELLPPRETNCAIFYSISNCRVGLKGIPFGNHLIKRVVCLLKEEWPQLRHFATLSPVPGLVKWLKSEHGSETAAPEGEELTRLAARYLLTAKDAKGQPVDPVARFHLGNGAELAAIHAMADMSSNGLAQSHGIMVNYRYELDKLDSNFVALHEMGKIAAAKAVVRLAQKQA